MGILDYMLAFEGRVMREVNAYEINAIAPNRRHLYGPDNAHSASGNVCAIRIDPAIHRQRYLVTNFEFE